VLLALIHSNSAKARRVAVSGLAAHGKATPEIVRALLHATEDPDEDVRGDAKMALKEVAPDAAAKAGIK
jgi:HEAT repeat protein